MSVEQAIHERWNLYRPLTDLVAADHLWTGNVPERDASGNAIEIPYASMLAQPKQQVTRSSSGNIVTNGTVTFMIWAATLDAVKRIIVEVVDHFNRATFDWSQGKMLDMKPGLESYEEDQERDSIWLGTLDFDFLLLQTDGT